MDGQKDIFHHYRHITKYFQRTAFLFCFTLSTMFLISVLRIATGTCTCGKANTSNRIVGGVDTEKHEYPWQVGLNLGGALCGGTIISSRHVLTAAHCTAGVSANDVSETVVKYGRLINEKRSITKQDIPYKYFVMIKVYVADHLHTIEEEYCT